MTATAKKGPKIHTPSNKLNVQGSGNPRSKIKIPNDQFVEAVLLANPLSWDTIVQKTGLTLQAVQTRAKKMVESGFLVQDDLPERQRGMTPTKKADLEAKIAELRKRREQLRKAS